MHQGDFFAIESVHNSERGLRKIVKKQYVENHAKTLHFGKRGGGVTQQFLAVWCKPRGF